MGIRIEFVSLELVLQRLREYLAGLQFDVIDTREAAAADTDPNVNTGW